MEQLTELFFTFFMIGAVSFGGGYAMIPFLQQEVVARNWLTVTEFTDIVAISQITPGPLAVNMATFIGYEQAGVIGGLLSTLGVTLPSFVMIIILVKFFVKFGEEKAVRYAFYGLRPAVTGLILASTIRIAQIEFFPKALNFIDYLNFSEINYKAVIISILAFIGLKKFKLHPIIVVVISAIIGLIVF